MNVWERKGIAKAERDLERKERKRHNANLRKSAITDVEYKSAARQAGYEPEDTNAFRIIYTTRDDQHEEEILRTYCKSAMEADDPVFDNYQSIHTTGTFFVWDKASEQIVLGIRVTPVQSNPDNNSSMDSIEKQSSNNANATGFGFFFQHIMRDLKLHAQIHSNGAQISGDMWAMGWRGGYEAGVPFDKYVYPENGKKKSEWEALRKNDYGMHSFYGTRFCSLAPALFASTQQISHLQSVPLWGHEFIVQHNDPDVQDYCFASNLTYTMSNRAGITFSNCPHKDNDGSLFTFGVWGLVDKITGTVQASENNAMVDGFFYIIPYRIKVDFAARTDCIWEIIWRGKRDVHGTVEGKVLRENWTWVGSSAQTSSTLIKRVENWMQNRK